MSSKPVFTILCASAMVVGFLTFIFGMIDRIGIQMEISFLMLPIWNGMLFGTAGFVGLMIGRQNKRQGYISSGMTSAVKAINMLCFGLSLLTFYIYGTIVKYIGFRIQLDFDNNQYYPTHESVVVFPKLQSTLDGTTDDDTRQGIFAVIILLSLVEMFIGAWIIMLEKERMIFGSSSSSDRVPLVTGEHASQYIQPAQFAQPSAHAGMVVASPQVPQQQQQPVYVVAPGGSSSLPARAVVAAPINQQLQQQQLQQQQLQQQQLQQQQPNYVVLQPSASMPTNQPPVIQASYNWPQHDNFAPQRPQPQYVVLQNQVPGNPPTAQLVNDEARSTDSPAPQAGDIRLTESSSSGVKE